MGTKLDFQSPSVKGESSPVSTVAWVCLVVAACYLAPKLEGVLIQNPQMIWPLWPGSAVLVSILLLVPGIALFTGPISAVGCVAFWVDRH